MTRASLSDRMDAKYVVRSDGCWEWTSYADPSGYGVIWVGGAKRQAKAHRVMYERHHGPIPDGHQIDHLCHTRSACPGGRSCLHRRCVNPDHLEAVTAAENIARSPNTPMGRKAAQDRCIRGHPFDEANTYRRPGGRRECRRCAADRARAQRATCPDAEAWRG